MKTLTREEVKKAFKEIVEKYGKPKAGEIYCEEQLISEIIQSLSCYDETNITYEYGEFKVSPSIAILSKYAPDHKFIGTVKIDEWFTKGQIKALHELGFGYQF